MAKESTVKEKEVTVGSNVAYVINGNMLTITVDLSKRLGPSSSGKTTIIATSSGNQPIAGTEAKLGLNIFTK
jgi:hypothetical protein